MKKKTFRIVMLVLYVVAMVAITVLSIPIIKSIKDPVEFKKTVDGFGAPGIVTVFFMQVLQVVVALIPGEFIEFFAGTMYGTFGGILLCLAGVVVGQTVVFASVKYFGKDFVEGFAGKGVFERFKFLNDKNKLNMLVFLLFFIPGTPKDLISYAVPFTPMKLRDFLIISLVARVPSIVTSTYAGYAFAERDFVILAIAYAGIFLVWALGYFGYRYYESKHKQK